MHSWERQVLPCSPSILGAQDQAASPGIQCPPAILCLSDSGLAGPTCPPLLGRAHHLQCRLPLPLANSSSFKIQLWCHLNRGRLSLPPCRLESGSLQAPGAPELPVVQHQVPSVLCFLDTRTFKSLPHSPAGTVAHSRATVGIHGGNGFWKFTCWPKRTCPQAPPATFMVNLRLLFPCRF